MKGKGTANPGGTLAARPRLCTRKLLIVPVTRLAAADTEKVTFALDETESDRTVVSDRIVSCARCSIEYVTR
jgi:hypothetical protein